MLSFRKKREKTTYLYWFIYAINKPEGYTIIKKKKTLIKKAACMCVCILKTDQIQDDKSRED